LRQLLAASAVLLAIGATPAMARDYPWCARTSTDGNPQCMFTSFGQCQATISGQGGDCIQNPGMAYGQGRGRRGGRSQDNWQDNGWQDNGWRNDGRDYRRW
jgi:hypothetical protein